MIRRKWIEAGFFIVSDGKPKPPSALLPPRIVTVSECIADTYPDYWGLPWVDDPDALRGGRETLALDDTAFADLRAWVERALSRGDFGWPNVFFSLDAAREFAYRYLRALPSWHVVGLSVAKDVADVFVRNEAPQEPSQGPGVWTMLARNTPMRQRGAALGFDVLGADYGGSFHTFSCNGLEKAFHAELGVAFNAHGLIDDYSRAAAASEYSNRDDVGTEPVAWYPFRVDDYGAGMAG